MLQGIFEDRETDGLVSDQNVDLRAGNLDDIASIVFEPGGDSRRVDRKEDGTDDPPVPPIPNAFSGSPSASTGRPSSPSATKRDADDRPVWLDDQAGGSAICRRHLPAVEVFEQRQELAGSHDPDVVDRVGIEDKLIAGDDDVRATGSRRIDEPVVVIVVEEGSSRRGGGR